MRYAGLFFVSSCIAAVVSAVGIVDAWLTMGALNDSHRAADINARLIATGGIETAAMRTVQMFGMAYAAGIALGLTPRPQVADALEEVWIVLALACWVSAIKELRAIWRRRHIVPDDWEDCE